MPKSKRPTKAKDLSFNKESLLEFLDRFDRCEVRHEIYPNPPAPKERFKIASEMALQYFSDHELDLMSWRLELELYLRFVARRERKVIPIGQPPREP
jgi:hypothetical protein